MPTKTLTTAENVVDFVRGCTFFGTGGGGRPSEGIRLLKEVLSSKGEITWMDANDIPEHGYTVCPFLMGSIAPWTDETFKQMKQLNLDPEKRESANLLTKSIELLSKFTGTQPEVVVPIELGGANTPAALTAASELNLVVVDGDYTGRAIPEIIQTTPHLNGKEICPIASWDQWGNVCYIEKSVNPMMAERIGKFLSAAAFGISGQAGFLIPVGDMKKIVVRGTLTECLEVGELIRAEREQGRNPVHKVAEKTGGKVLFKGTVAKKHWEDREGYYWGYHEIAGFEEFEGHKFKIWFKNENHISWLDDTPYVTSPDMLIVVQFADCEPLYNPDIQEGMKVAVIGIPARKEFLSKNGLQVLGPKYFGFDIEYRPFEEITKK